MSEIRSFLSRIGLVFHWIGFGIAIIFAIAGIVGVFDEGLGMLVATLFSPVPLFIGWVIRWLMVGGKVPYLPYQD